MAGRDKDLALVAGLLRYQPATSDVIRKRLAATNLDPSQRQLCLARLKRLAP